LATRSGRIVVSKYSTPEVCPDDKRTEANAIRPSRRFLAVRELEDLFIRRRNIYYSREHGGQVMKRCAHPDERGTARIG
jgi:hypothetical protein